VAEGRLVVRRLLESRFPVRSVLVSPAGLAAMEQDLAAAAAPVFVAEPAVLEQVAGFDVHRGVLACAARLPLPTATDVIEGARRLAVVEDLTDHENLGALFRNAAAFGLDAVLLSPRCCDPLYRRSVRVSVGAALTVPYTRLAPWPGGLEQLRAHGFALVALTPDPESEPLDDLARRPPDRLAVVVGAEGPGLTDEVIAACDRSVHIPMAPGVDSLNVATAAAIAFHRTRPT